jgi:hypothetical protein
MVATIQVQPLWHSPTSNVNSCPYALWIAPPVHPHHAIEDESRTDQRELQIFLLSIYACQDSAAITNLKVFDSWLGRSGVLRVL